jgi:hypothetical protein
LGYSFAIEAFKEKEKTKKGKDIRSL